MMNQPRFERRPSKPTLHPRRVVGGLRLQARAAAAAAAGAPLAQSPDPSTPAPELTPAPAPPVVVDVASPAAPTGWNWASARWIRLAEAHAPDDQLAEGLEYARAGQTRSLDIVPGSGLI